MVFENVYSQEYLNNNKHMVLILSFSYTILGISASYLLFRDFNSSLVSIGFTSLILLTVLRDILKISVKSEIAINEKKINLMNMLKQYKNDIIIFTYLFIGILLGFSIFSLGLPSEVSEKFFSSQYEFLVTNTPHDVFSHGTFESILLNNLAVLIICLITSFLFGIGTIFLFILVWNGSVIGTIFTEIAKQSAISLEHSQIIIFLVLLLAALPHMIFEIFSYLLSGIIGENLSDYLLAEKPKNSKYKKIINFTLSMISYSIIFLLIAVYIEINFPEFIINSLL